MGMAMSFSACHHGRRGGCSICDRDMEVKRLRARLRKVQQAAREHTARYSATNDSWYWPRWLKQSFWGSRRACNHCCRALPAEGQCRCGGEE